MARLIIVTGATGAGKSFLLEQLQRLRGEIKPIKKLTTRTPRPTEPSGTSLDLIFNCTDAQVNSCDYTYNYCGNNYGIKRNDIDRVLRSGKSPIVIVASCSTIERMKADYKIPLVLYVKHDVDEDKWISIMNQRGDSVGFDERKRRLQYSQNDYNDYVNKELFNYVLFNDFEDELMQSVQKILTSELIVDYNFMFVIMPFKTDYDDIYLAYKNAARAIGFRRNAIIVKRNDEMLGDIRITDAIIENIKKAGLIFCDVTDNNPNVFFELGFARGLKKNMVITAKEDTKLPFDVQGNRTVFYKTPMELQEKMICELKNHYHIMY